MKKRVEVRKASAELSCGREPYMYFFEGNMYFHR